VKGQMSEAQWQAQVVQLAQTFGWLVQHTRPAKVGDKWVTPITGDVGFPDLVLAHPERGVLFAELKAERGRLSAGQVEWGRVLKAAGAECYLWRPDDLTAVLKRLRGKR
jgi:hypothetical protein